MAIKPVEVVIKATDKATPEIKNLVKAVDAIDPAAKRAGASSDASLDGMQKRGMKAADGIKSISEQLALVQKAFVVFQGGGMLGGLIKDAAQTADEYNNLAARIKLATGEGELFEQAMAAVTDISLRTNSSLQSTGNLFARLTDAGKSAGLSAQEAQSQALSLTESINQAVAVSGASSQASDAALTQLIQGLQSGVLRGEEFNSIMEQSPRLAKALADGLSVTTGELRKMSNEGRLTTDVVIGALKSQADTLKSEFETLPPTVGRAIQNLSTSWTVYVGEADKATGASKLAASAIEVLAKNLDTIAGYLLDAGQAAAAFAALKLAQTFLGIGAAATASATAVAANTVAMNAANVAATTAAVGVGRFAVVLGALKTLTLLGVVTNFKDIGTWIGEGIAKLQGYKDKTDELAAAERSRLQVGEEQRKIVQAQALANREAMESQFELSKAAQSSLGVFDDLVAKGKTAGEAVAEIGKGFDLSSSPGIANAAAVLDKLAADGKLSAEQFRQAWAEALKGEDLQAFEVKARTALAGTARESERLAAVMDGTLREAIRRSGGDFDVLAGGMSKAARSAVNDVDTIINGMDRLKAQGIAVGQALELSLNKAVKTADSQAAIEALRARVEQVRKLLGDQVADGLLKAIEEQAKKAVGSVTELDNALKLLGVKTREDMQRTAVEFKKAFETARDSGMLTADQLSDAFKKYAEAAIAANGGVATELLKSQAEAYGLEIAVDKTGKAIVRAMGEGENATGKFNESMKDSVKQVEGLMAWLDRLEKRNAAVKSSIISDKDGFAVDADGKRISQAIDDRGTSAKKLESMGVDAETAKRLAAQVYDERGNYIGKSSGAYRDGDTLDAVLARLAKSQTGRAGVGVGSWLTYEDGSKSYDLNNEMRRNSEERGHPWKSGFQGVGRTVQVNINTGRGTETVNTDEEGATAIVRALQIAGLSAGR